MAVDFVEKNHSECRVVFGTDSQGRHKAVFVARSLSYVVNLDEGISREAARATARQMGFEDTTYIVLVYYPPSIKHGMGSPLRDHGSDVFWVAMDVEGSHQLFMDFYSGSVVAVR
jgi:hypothetical protein